MSPVKSGELRVVLDTNVFISVFKYPLGRLFWIWQMALARRYKLLISPAIVDEIGDVLRRKSGWDDSRLVNQLKLLAKTAEIVQPTTTLHVVQDDDDNRILECAQEGKAGLIVSGDRDLRSLKSFRGIPIVSPADFERILGR